MIQDHKLQCILSFTEDSQLAVLLSSMSNHTNSIPDHLALYHDYLKIIIMIVFKTIVLFSPGRLDVDLRWFHN